MREEDGDDSLLAEQSILRALVFNYGDGSLFWNFVCSFIDLHFFFNIKVMILDHTVYLGTRLSLMCRRWGRSHRRYRTQADISDNKCKYVYNIPGNKFNN